MGHIPPPWQMDPLPCRVAGKSIPESRNSGRTTHFHLWDTPCLDHQPIKHNIGTAGGNTSRSREVVSSSSMELPAVYRHIPRKRCRKTIGPRTIMDVSRHVSPGGGTTVHRTGRTRTVTEPWSSPRVFGNAIDPQGTLGRGRKPWTKGEAERVARDLRSATY